MPEQLLRENRQNKSATVPPSDGLVPLESILCTEELKRRPSRPPDYETENRALAVLAQALADSPRTILQTLADTILKLFKTGSAGMSLLTKDEKNFYWAAIAGAWKPHLGGGTPRDFGPCGDILDCNRPLLFKRWERRYPYLLDATPLAEEGLLIPFYVAGKAVGTIWAIAHDDRRKFDAEDLRQLESIGKFASAAYQTVTSLDVRDQRRAALNLMEDAIIARQALEVLNLELRESEERYRTLFDLGPVAVYSCDAAGVIQNFNLRAAELWGREPALGDTDERFCGSYKLFRPDGSFMPHEQCPMAEVVAGKIQETRDQEVLIERPDGSRITVVVNIRPLKNQSGEVTGAVNCFYDVTERKVAESALRESEKRYRELLNALPVAVYTTDADGTITLFNEAAAAFAGRRAQAGKDRWCVTHRLYRPDGSPLPHDECPMAVTLRTGKPQLGVEAIAERPDGTRVSFIPHPTLVHDASGAIIGGINVLVDITDRKLAEAALIKSEKLAASGRLAATLAHEINNPLQAVTNLISLLGQSPRLNAQDKTYAAMAEEELRRVVHLTQQSLSFYREATFPTAIHVERVLDNVLDLYGKRIQAKELTVAKRYDSNGTAINSYPGETRQVFSTLLVNAMDAVSTGGTITIHVSKSFHWSGSRIPGVRITIADNGIGIPMPNIDRIFEPFFTTKGQHGTGLGLWVTHGIVSRLGGSISVRSSARPEKSGTIFSIFLPCEMPK